MWKIKTILKRKLKNSEFIVLIYDKIVESVQKYFVSDKKAIKQDYKKNFNSEVELKNPLKFNDKLQWLKLNWYDPLATKSADKYEVREIVKERIGAKYLNDLIGVYENVEEIDLNELPNKFVLKGTHGSGFNIICEDKSKMNWESEFREMRRWLRKNYYYKNREWIYKDIKPRIICEKFLSDKDGNIPKDYKFFCFDGEPKFMFIASDRGEGTKFDFYDLEWNKIPVSQHYPNSDYDISKPEKLKEMLSLSRKLSEGFPQVRVDFYYTQGKIIFGELTFFHFSGLKKFSPEKYDEIFGQYIDLTKIVNKEYRG